MGRGLLFKPESSGPVFIRLGGWDGFRLAAGGHDERTEGMVFSDTYAIKAKVRCATDGVESGVVRPSN